MPLAIGIRDRIGRFLVSEKEPQREALRVVARDRTLPLLLRIKAQLELQKFPRYNRPVALHNRCIVSGKSRGYISAFKLNKIVFRENALAGQLPGVRKALF